MEIFCVLMFKMGVGKEGAQLTLAVQFLDKICRTDVHNIPTAFLSPLVVIFIGCGGGQSSTCVD